MSYVSNIFRNHCRSWLQISDVHNCQRILKAMFQVYKPCAAYLSLGEGHPGMRGLRQQWVKQFQPLSQAGQQQPRPYRQALAHSLGGQRELHGKLIYRQKTWNYPRCSDTCWKTQYVKRFHTLLAHKLFSLFINTNNYTCNVNLSDKMAFQMLWQMDYLYIYCEQ